MKKLFVALFVTAMAPLAYGQYGTAATPEAAKTPPAAAAGNASDQSALTSQSVSGQNAAKVLGPRNCLRETGSHIVRKDKDTCVNATGQAYGETAIERTGTYDTGEALEKLSPAVQVRGR
jgi:hypothetical protein